MTQPFDTTPPDLQRLRHEYQQRTLSEHDVDPDPIRQFILWLNQAIAARLDEPNAMTLATATPQGVPSARIVLLKQVDASGFVFYTNYLSRKGHELEHNPHAALLFYWPPLEREVRIEGEVSRVSDQESDEYFASRPIESRIGSAASPQSQPIPSRDALEYLFTQLSQKHPDGNIPRPPHWGGYRLRPRRIEFWQGRPGRLHDRIDYTLTPGSNPTWTLRRLAP